MVWRILVAVVLLFFSACNVLDCAAPRSANGQIGAGFFALVFGLFGVALFIVGVRHKAPIPAGLGQCPDCKRAVSLHAQACPHCGRPRNLPV